MKYWPEINEYISSDENNFHIENAIERHKGSTQGDIIMDKLLVNI